MGSPDLRPPVTAPWDFHQYRLDAVHFNRPSLVEFGKAYESHAQKVQAVIGLAAGGTRFHFLPNG